MKVLIIGSGAREHALAWHVARTERVTHVFVAPGNGGTATETKCKNIAIDACDIAALKQFALEQSIDYTIVGPEAPLCAGIVDEFLDAGLPCLGPKKFAAQLEKSKAFSKKFMQDHGIPTASYQSFTDHAAALAYLQQQHHFPLVIKADGLAAGKGVVIAQSLKEAEAALHSMMVTKQFDQAGNQVVIEEFLQGEEASFMVVTDGRTVYTLVPTQDHKALNDGDQGLNTGGMGAYAPAPLITEKLHDEIMTTVITPTLKALNNMGHSYQGFLYAGLMIDKQQNIKVLEFNCRLGDPEAEVILPTLATSLVDICAAVATQQLQQLPLQWHAQHIIGVVLAAPGYPENYKKNIPINLDALQTIDHIKVFHGGTQLQNGQLFSTGGRVLCVVAEGDTLLMAQQRVYAALEKLAPLPFHYRHDIGCRGIKASSTL